MAPAHSIEQTNLLELEDMHQDKNVVITVKYLLIGMEWYALVVKDNYAAFLEVEKARKNI